MFQTSPQVVCTVHHARKRVSRSFQMLAIAIFGAFASALPASADPMPVESMSLNFLFPMEGGSATRAAAIAELSRSPIAIDVWEHAIAGSARDASGGWVPAFWLCNNEVIEGPFLFLADDGRGQADGVAVDPNNPNVVYFSGTILDDQSVARAALWTVNLETLATDERGHAVRGVRFQAFPGQFSGGVRVAVGDINGDGVSDIAIGGTTTALLVPAIQKSRVWVHIGGTRSFSQVDLPVVNPNGGSGIQALSIELENVLVSGFSANSAGQQQATLWRLRNQDIEVENDETHWTVQRSFLPGGTPSQARTETVSNNETIMMGGSRTNGTGKTLPAIWLASNVSVGWQGHNLPLSNGFDNGRANGIIAILIGLLIPGEMNGPNGPSAAIWIVDVNGRALAIDLNSIPSGLESGTHLRTVNCILPYIEQDNIYKVLGSARSPSGGQLGYVGEIVGSAQ